MIDDIASLAAVPRTVTLGGERHQVTPLSIHDLGTLQDWVDQQFPNPYDVANREIERGRASVDDAGNPCRVAYSVPMQQFLLRVAAEQAERGQRKIGTPEADSKLHTVEGMKQLLLISLRKTRPEFSAEDADRLFRAMTVADVAQLVAITNLEMVTSDPKAPTPSGPETPATKPNRKERRKRARSTGGSSTTGR